MTLNHKQGKTATETWHWIHLFNDHLTPEMLKCCQPVKYKYSHWRPPIRLGTQGTPTSDKNLGLPRVRRPACHSTGRLGGSFQPASESVPDVRLSSTQLPPATQTPNDHAKLQDLTHPDSATMANRAYSYQLLNLKKKLLKRDFSFICNTSTKLHDIQVRTDDVQKYQK